MRAIKNDENIKNHMSVRRLTILSVFTAAALLMHLIEGQLPQLLPVPGVKLGLANVVTIVVMCLMSRRDAAMVLFARILLGSLFSGRFLSLIYSLSGGTLSFALCAFILPIFGRRQIWALSVAGSLAHIIGQLCAAAAVTGILSVFTYLPVLILSALVSGLFTGICAQLVVLRFGSSAHWKKIIGTFR